MMEVKNIKKFRLACKNPKENKAKVHQTYLMISHNPVTRELKKEG